MPSDNDYMRKYVLKRYHRRRLKAIKYLGGKCAECESTENLQIDHIDPAQKSFDIAKALAGWAWDRILKELEKCQLLCKTHHDYKHQAAKRTHGTLSAYRYCKCDKCRKAMSIWNREYKKRRKLNRTSK